MSVARMQTGDADIIKGRKTLAAVIEPEARLLLSDGALVEFKNRAWMGDGVITILRDGACTTA